MSKTCYMCEAEATSAEHVPPKCFFPEKKDLEPGLDYRKNLLTVPACDVHNSAKSKDDEYLLTVIAGHYENNKTSKDHYGAKILRSLKHSPGLTKRLLEGSQPVVQDGRNTTAINVDIERFQRELSNIARALYFNEFKKRCEKPVQVHTASLRGEGFSLREDAQGLINMAAPVLYEAPVKGENPKIFAYRVASICDDRMTFIRMLFFEGFDVLAVISDGLEQVPPD